MLRLYVREGQGGRVQDNPRYAGGPQTGEKFVIFWCGVCFRLYKRCRDFHTGGGHGERIAVIAYLPHRHRAPTHVRDGDALPLVPCGGVRRERHSLPLRRIPGIADDFAVGGLQYRNIVGVRG